MTRLSGTGARSAVSGSRTDVGAAPGTMIGGDRTTCYGCEKEFPSARMRVRPRGAKAGTPRRFLCAKCDRRLP